MDICRAVEEDKMRVLPLLREVIGEGKTYSYDPASTDDQLLALWFAESNVVYIAEDDSGIVGTYYIKPNQPGLGAHVCNAGFMVSKKYAGRSMGTALGQHALKEANRLGYRAMQFNNVVTTNAPAIHIWKKLGFKIIGTIPEAFRHPKKGLVDSYIMYRKL